MIKVIVTDIDNTITVKHRDISNFTKETIIELQKCGILFGLASGRSIKHLIALENKWGIKSDFLIGNNGSELYDAKTNVTESFYKMKPEWIKQAFEIMEEFDTNLYMCSGDEIYYTKEDQISKNSIKYINSGERRVLVKDVATLYNKPTFKVGFRVKSSDMIRIENKVKSLQLDGFCGFKTEFNMYEFCNSYASKGNLLKEYCNRYNINKDNVCSFGDMTNDISLFNESKYSVCMINGSEDAKKSAKYITERDVENDGFAYYIQKNVLGKK